ncbi:MAG: MarR family winged helix-turn-helix transcriptional regulator [Gemmatimonadaceae bacterium]
MTPSPDRTGLADRVHSAAIHLLRRLRKQDEASGLTAARLSALSVVVFGGPVTMGQLASAEQVSAPTMTRLVTGLERDGLVKRERDVSDGRVSWIRATAKGDRILREGRRRRVAELARELEALSPAEAEHLARAADVIERITGRSATALGATTPPPPPPRDVAPAASRAHARRRRR